LLSSFKETIPQAWEKSISFAYYSLLQSGYLNCL